MTLKEVQPPLQFTSTTVATPSHFVRRTATTDIIHEIYSTHAAAMNKSARELISKSRIDDKENDRTLATGCIDTVASLAILFSGPKKAKAILPKLVAIFDRTLYLKSPAETLTIHVKNLFTGSVLKRLEKEEMEREVTRMGFIQLASKHLGGIIKPFQEKALKTLGEPSKHLTQDLYDFNRDTFTGFHHDLSRGKSTLQPQESNIFYLVTMLPVENDYVVDHAFILEQFWNETLQEPCYRKYQSWANQSNLAEDMLRNGFLKGEPWNMSQDEMTTFLYQLQCCVCQSPLTPKEVVNMKAHLFGYFDASHQELYSFSTEGMAFTGLSFRYAMDTIKTDDFSKHMKDFLNEEPSLKSNLDLLTLLSNFQIPC